MNGTNKERLDDLSAEATRAMDALEQSVTSARRILITVSIVCGFLFITVFEMVFGWQQVRPAASTYFFAERLTQLTVRRILLHGATDSLQHSSQSKVHHSFYESLVLELAYLYSKELLKRDNLKSYASDTSIDHDELRHDIEAKLRKLPTWRKEEMLREFSTQLSNSRKRVETMLAESLKVVLAPDTNSKAEAPRRIRDASLSSTGDVADSPSVIRDDSVLKAAAHRRTRDEQLALTGSAFDSLLVIRDDSVSKAINEILERYEVNEETRGRRVGPRTNVMPILGISAQLEDTHPSMGLILLLLMYWFYAASKNTDEAYRICRGFIQDKRRLIMWAASAYYHIVWHERSKNGLPPIELRRGLVFMALTPYLVIASAILGNLHELFVLDPRNHGSSYFVRSEITGLAVFENVVMLAVATIVAFLARKTWKSVTQRYSQMLEDMEVQDVKHSGATALFWLLIASPAIVFAPFTMAQALHPERYFPSSGWLLGICALWLVFFGFIYAAYKERRWSRLIGLFKEGRVEPDQNDEVVQ